MRCGQKPTSQKRKISFHESCSLSLSQKQIKFKDVTKQWLLSEGAAFRFRFLSATDLTTCELHPILTHWNHGIGKDEKGS